MDPNKKRTLGIDYGRKRIGLAISDPLRIIAQAHATISCKRRSDAISEIKRVIAQYDIGDIVVGHPLSLTGEEGAIAREANRFAAELRRESDLPIAMLDERFTTKIATDTLLALGKSPGKNKDKTDKIAAAVILQNYLDRNKGSGATIAGLGEQTIPGQP